MKSSDSSVKTKYYIGSWMRWGILGVIYIMGTVPVQNSPRFLGELFHNNLLKIQPIEKLSANPTQLSESLSLLQNNFLWKFLAVPKS